MQKSKIVTLLKQRLGNREDLDIAQRIDEELDIAQYELERMSEFVPWFLLVETSGLAEPGYAKFMELPGFLEEWEEGTVYFAGESLEKGDYGKLVQLYKDTVGPPERYAMVGDTVFLFPVPDAEYEVTVWYYKEDEAPSNVDSSEENLWMKNAANWLLAKTGVNMSSYIRDENAFALFSADLQRAEVSAYKRHISAVEDSVSRNMGDE
jgi:hypothetical protein